MIKLLDFFRRRVFLLIVVYTKYVNGVESNDSVYTHI